MPSFPCTGKSSCSFFPASVSTTVTLAFFCKESVASFASFFKRGKRRELIPKTSTCGGRIVASISSTVGSSPSSTRSCLEAACSFPALAKGRREKEEKSLSCTAFFSKSILTVSSSSSKYTVSIPSGRKSSI